MAVFVKLHHGTTEALTPAVVVSSCPTTARERASRVAIEPYTKNEARGSPAGTMSATSPHPARFGCSVSILKRALRFGSLK
jgi:hypothetical protein